jgi:hypothetical protein
MQTFLPHPCFAKSAASLDNRRLGKQRVECLQILRSLNDPDYGWKNHPAVKMWQGYSKSLALYGVAICDEWIRRGFKDTCRDKISLYLPAILKSATGGIPPWVTDELCLSHQSNLIRKDSAHYAPQFPNVPNDLPYVWPA